MDYTLAAAKAFIDVLAPQLPTGQKFRFLFCSGRWAEMDEKKNMRMLADTRRIKVSSAPRQRYIISISARRGFIYTR